MSTYFQQQIFIKKKNVNMPKMSLKTLFHVLHILIT
jgi:hypothetical protein